MARDLPTRTAELVASIREFGETHLVPEALARCRQTAFPRGIAAEFAGRGWSGLAAKLPEEGGGVLAAVAGLETVARSCPRAADAFHQLNFGAALLLARHAAGERQRRALRDILAGELLVAVAITEEDAGAQAAATRSRVTHGDSGARLGGHKVFCANSSEADAFVVYAGFGPSVGDIGAVLIERSRARLAIGQPRSFMNGETWSRLEFADLPLNEEDIVFSAGGFVEKAGFFDIEKLGNAARALGLGWCAFDLARRYALERRQFGRPLCEFQGVQWKFAESSLQLEAARLMLHRAAGFADEGRLTGDEAARAKIHCNRAAMTASDMAVQVMGATGFGDGALAEYCFRKARGHLINGGTIELMLTRVAEAVFERKFPQHAG